MNAMFYWYGPRSIGGRRRESFQIARLAPSHSQRLHRVFCAVFGSHEPFLGYLLY